MYDFNWTTMIYVMLLIPIGIFLGCGLVYAFNHIPEKWLTESGEEPEEKPDGQRIPGMPWKLVLSAFFAVSGIYMLTIGGHGFTYVLPLLIILWLLMIIAISDAKYMIIPDQFVVFLILMAGALIPFGMSLRDMFFGAAAGAGTMLLVAVVGYFITRRESLGFGDVKLMAAIGLITGLYQCVGIMVIAAIISGITFFVKVVKKQLKPHSLMPLAPYLAGCAMASLILF